MHNLAPLIYDLALMLGIAGIVILLFQRIHQPVVLGYLVAGMIIGPYTPPYSFVNDIHNIKTLSELGVIFLMFSLGLEFSFQKLTRVGFSASITGILEVISMMGIGYITGMYLGWSTYDCLFLGAALSISSTTIIIKAIDELGLKTKRFAELIFGVLIVEDLLAILLLVALSTIVITNNVFSKEMVYATVKLFLVVGGWFLVGYFVVPLVFRKIVKYINQETLTIISVALCLFLVCIAASFNYSTALGAFIMGSILAETVLVHRIVNLIRPIRDIFAAVFFISIGMLIDPLVIVRNWEIVLLLSAITITGKILTTTISAFLTGQSINTAIRVGFSMAQIGEFSFIIVALGLALQVTDSKLYPLIVAVSGITAFTTPYLIRLSEYGVETMDKLLPQRMKLFLFNYSAWVYRARSVSQQPSVLGTVSVRLISNGIVVALIFILLHYFIFHRYDLYTQGSTFGNLLLLSVSLALASPFIWGMLFSLKNVDVKKNSSMSITPALFLIWVLTFSEVAILSIFYFHTWLSIGLFLIISVTLFTIAYKHLEKSYHWFEDQLVSNLITNHGENVKYAELAPWDTHLVEIEVGEHSLFVGKTLSECQIRQNYGVNIVAIAHGSRVITAPRGEEKIISFDKLIALGNDAQLEAFKEKVETELGHKNHSDRILETFILRPVVLDHASPLIGLTIRNSKIREAIQGLVVGLERDNIRILNPDPDTVLRVGDLLLLVGDFDLLKNFDAK